jgi:hypothetical protein
MMGAIMANDLNASAPPVPPSAPSDWSTVVLGNPYSNVQRLARWIGGIKPIASKVDPSPYFIPIAQEPVVEALEDGTWPTLYVIAHGWAPGYRTAVDAQGGKLQWWGKEASVNGRWASDWAWAPVGPLTSPAFPVSSTGLCQQIVTQDPTAVVVLYSWIDDSATDDSKTSDYESEAHTHVNGMRLANALLTTVNPNFFKDGGRIHLIGHSHGSKVCTVAALTLQQQGVQAAQLTILDSPETNLPLESNGANLLGFYLQGLKIQNQSYDCAAGTFVENYPSCFGVGYASSDPKSPLNNVVEVALKPSKIYGYMNMSDAHTYAAAWYSGAAVGAKAQGQPPVGLAWPPVPKDYQPALNQTWPGTGYSQANQWLLTPGPSQIVRYAYTPSTLAVDTSHTTGNVYGTPSTGLAFLPASPNRTKYSTFAGTFVANHSDQYGLTFDLEWTSPQPGDYLVVSIGGWSTYTLLVMDGQSAPAGKTSIAINSDLWNTKHGTLTIYYLGSSQYATTQVVISNFQWLAVTNASGASLRPQAVQTEEVAP